MNPATRGCLTFVLCRGLTLVELMVAMALGLIVVVALGVVYAANSRTRHEIERAGQQLENGRFALELLSDDIHHAGHYGGLIGGPMQPVSPCVPRTGVALNAVNLGWQSAPLALPLPIHGYAAGNVPAADTCLSNQKPGSDVLIVRSVESSALGIATAAGASYDTDFFLQTSRCGDAAIDPVPFVVAVGGSGAAARFPLHEKDCATPAVVRRLVVRAYYVGRCSVCTGSGDGIPSLRMVELSGSTATSASVVEGIEAMRVEYAFDLAESGQIDAVRRCESGVDPCVAAEWPRVAAVQLHVLARQLTPSPDHVDTKTYAMGAAGSVGPFNDRYKRRLYPALVVARNLTGPRER